MPTVLHHLAIPCGLICFCHPQGHQGPQASDPAELPPRGSTQGLLSQLLGQRRGSSISPRSPAQPASRLAESDTKDKAAPEAVPARGDAAALPRHEHAHGHADPESEPALEPAPAIGRPFRQAKPGDRPRLAQLLRRPASHLQHDKDDAVHAVGSGEPSANSSRQHEDTAEQGRGGQDAADVEDASSIKAPSEEPRPKSGSGQHWKLGQQEDHHAARHAQAGTQEGQDLDQRSSGSVSSAGQYKQPAFVQLIERHLRRSGTLGPLQDQEAPQGSRWGSAAGSAPSENHSGDANVSKPHSRQPHAAKAIRRGSAAGSEQHSRHVDRDQVSWTSLTSCYTFCDTSQQR